MAAKLLISVDPKVLKNEYMEHGGNQLVEILQNEISYEWIKRNKEELHITDIQFNCMTTWLENDCRMAAVQNKYDLPSATAKSFMYRGGGILKKLYKLIDTSPIIDETGRISSRHSYSFIRYEIINNGDYTITISKPNENNWSDYDIRPEYNEIFFRFHFFKKNEEGKLEKVKSNDEFIEDFKCAYATFYKLGG